MARVSGDLLIEQRVERGHPLDQERSDAVAGWVVERASASVREPGSGLTRDRQNTSQSAVMSRAAKRRRLTAEGKVACLQTVSGPILLSSDVRPKNLAEMRVMRNEEMPQDFTFQFSIPAPSGALPVSLKVGTSLMFVGANGGGKTRLAVLIEQVMGARSHRISAHRALTLNPGVAKIPERLALAGLRTGHGHESADLAHRSGRRWHGKEAVALLNDFDYLIQALFAEQTNRALNTHRRNRADDHTKAQPTNLERLADIWHRLLPHRRLHVTGDDIQVSIPESTARYAASEMSDGERAIFYMIGQALTADANSLLIIDEPELHVHRSIMARLWDEIEAARHDCAFIYITHDLEFAASRTAQKFVIRAYDPTPHWTIETVPPNTGFSEELTTLILGTRRPILFVEGGDTSLDLPLYRACYPEWTVIPRGSCEEVLHSVATMRRNKDLTRVTCAGLVDADDYGPDEAKALADEGVAVLPVSELENLIALPSISRAILEHEGFTGETLQCRLDDIKKQLFDFFAKPGVVENAVLRYCKRRIDRALKRVELRATNEADLAAEYAKCVSGLNIQEIADRRRNQISAAVDAADLPALLAFCDNKGVLAVAALVLKTTRKDAFEGWLTRVLTNDSAPAIVAAVRKILPEIAQT